MLKIKDHQRQAPGPAAAGHGHRRAPPHAADPVQRADHGRRRQGGLPRHRPRGADHLDGRPRRQRRRLGHGRRAQALRHPALAARGCRGLARGQGKPHDGEGGQEPLQPADARRGGLPAMVEAKDASKTLTLPQKALKDALRPGAVRHGGAGHPLLPERRALLGGQGHAARRRHRRPPPVVREPGARAATTAASRRSCRARPCSS